MVSHEEKNIDTLKILLGTVLGLSELESPFPCSSPHSAVLCTRSWNSTDITPVLCLLLRGAGTASGLLPSPQEPAGWGWASDGEGTVLGQLT